MGEYYSGENQDHFGLSSMGDLKLSPPLLSVLERIEQHSGTLLMLAVAASGGQDGKLNKLRGAGYVMKCDHPNVTEGHGLLRLSRSPRSGRRALAKTVPNSPRR